MAKIRFVVDVELKTRGTPIAQYADTYGEEIRYMVSSFEEVTRTKVEAVFEKDPLTPEEALQLIRLELSGKEWGADTLDAVAGHIRAAGLVIKDAWSPPDEETLGS